MVLKILAFSHFLWGILWWFVITFHSSWVIISSYRRRIYARKRSATNSFQMDKNSQKAKGYGTHRAISQTFYSMLTDGKDVKVGERLMLFWVDNRIRSYAEDFYKLTSWQVNKLTSRRVACYSIRKSPFFYFGFRASWRVNKSTSRRVSCYSIRKSAFFYLAFLQATCSLVSLLTCPLVLL